MLSTKLNILVYSGPGATSLSTHEALHTLRSLLTPHYAVSTISANALLREPWASTCALLVFPGGADLGYCRALNGAGTGLVKNYVRLGGAYLGFCAGAYFGSARCEFEADRKGMEVIGSRELALFPGTCRGGAFKGFEYASEAGTRAARLDVTAAGREEEAVVYCNGGGVFVDAGAMGGKGVQVLARYAEDIDVDAGDGGGAAAIVYCKVGSGHAVLAGPHPEFDPALLQPQPGLPDYGTVLSDLRAGNESRVRLMKTCLGKLGLAVADEPSPILGLTCLHMSSLGPGEVDDQLAAFREAITRDGGGETIRAEMDVFRLRLQNEPDDSNEAGDGDQSGSRDALQSLGFQNDQVPPDQKDKSGVDSGQKTEWDLITHNDTWPTAEETPKWDHNLYFTSLRAYHAAQRDRHGIADWGRQLLYGEVVTSTYTLLEKNTTLLSFLPTGFTFAASAQLAGRGRGSNAWVSPEGSLIFSTVVNHPASMMPTRPLAFIQYVAAIAVAEAVQGYDDGHPHVPVRLKWPNDIYAKHPDSSQDHPEFVKIGGILSSCAYSSEAQTYQVIVGIGVNVNNAKPTTSLSALLPTSLPPFRNERLLASILANFGSLYNTFLRTGFTGELERRYYKYWLHTGQLVTVAGDVASRTDAGRAWRGKVLGVTGDWGMLRVEEVDGGQGGNGTGKIYELQSDENSFDFWKGLVRRRLDLR